MPIEMNKKQNENLIDFLTIIFFRMVALFLLVFALQYWVQVLGLNNSANTRFDLMPEHWQIASVILCVILPIAAVGLWGRFSWGPIVWIMVIATEVVMYFSLPHLFGFNNPVLIFHLITIAIFAFFFVLQRLIGNKE